MKRRIHLFFLSFIFFGGGLYAQKLGKFKIPDSLKDKSTQEIYKKYEKNDLDTAQSLVYLQSYLQKAKLEGDKVSMARGHSLLYFYLKDDDIKLKHVDSSISIGKSLKHPYYPSYPYSIKGGHYYHKLNFKKALHYFFLSLEFAKKNNGEYYLYSAKHNISVIKSKLGKYEESLKGFRECLEYGLKSKDTLDFLYGYLYLGETYTKMNKLDSSSFYNEKGLRISELRNDDIYYEFIFNEGVNHYYKDNYKEALDSINKSLPFLPTSTDKNYLLNAYLYLGKIHEKINKNDVAKVYYEKIDSVYHQSGKVSSEVREAYSALVKQYKEKKDTDNQLIYIEKLLQFDSVLQNDYKELNEILVKKYDTPELLAEKERLVREANLTNSKYSKYITILIIAVAIFIGLFGYQFYRRRRFQKRFEILLEQKNSNQENQKEVSINKKVSDAEIGISSNIVEEVLEKLMVFESNKEFLSSKVTLTQLSSELGTNNKYLSKIINTYKEKSFSQYINDLRIDFVVERLTTDKKLRNYTIKAIAREVGFNSAEVFSRTFYTRHGIYPSYFIKKLEKHK
ncbi:AraC family transcriptional regulator [Aquimarina pacifica]|uniref:AraC family transcriptional regulator n=1 Tax=Aquimarina pacifica TaxID=1296415 RepID=UPI00046E6CF8|nr:AraC family transcriptional regulator [Aquimarina pacifica]